MRSTMAEFAPTPLKSWFIWPGKPSEGPIRESPPENPTSTPGSTTRRLVLRDAVLVDGGPGDIVTEDELMTRVFELAVEATDRGDEPFGALLAVNGEIVETARNRIYTDSDITAHAETHLVRKLERAGTLGLLAEGVVYASCEPCPMCVGAMFWAGTRHVTYGLSHTLLNELAKQPGQPPYGFTVGAGEIGGTAQPPMSLRGPIREADAAKVHQDYWPTARSAS